MTRYMRMESQDRIVVSVRVSRSVAYGREVTGLLDDVLVYPGYTVSDVRLSDLRVAVVDVDALWARWIRYYHPALPPLHILRAEYDDLMYVLRTVLQ